MPLKDAGPVFDPGKSSPFAVGFPAYDDGRRVTVLVCDEALDAKEDGHHLPDYRVACETHIDYLLKVASAKYDMGRREADGSVLVKRTDIGGW
jgi:hypothetical protein